MKKIFLIALFSFSLNSVTNLKFTVDRAYFIGIENDLDVDVYMDYEGGIFGKMPEDNPFLEIRTKPQEKKFFEIDKYYNKSIINAIIGRTFGITFIEMKIKNNEYRIQIIFKNLPFNGSIYQPVKISELLKKNIPDEKIKSKL